MNKRNMSTVGAGFYTIGVIFVILVILAALGVGDEPKCAHYNCDREVTHEGDYCYMHDSDSYQSNGIKKSTSSGSSYNGYNGNSTSGSNYNSYDGNSTSGSNYNSAGSYSLSNSNNTSSSSNNKKYNSNNSYDDGYDDVYMDDDYDLDRYWEDDDYASGVDDALEDMDDGDW